MSPRTVSPGLARLRAHPAAESIRQSVIADNAAAVAEIAVSHPAVDCAPKAPAPAAKPAAALSEGAVTILRALFQVAADGEWIGQKAIPHGFSNGKSVAAFLGGLYKRKLVDLRGDGGGKFSARLTSAGAALMAEPAP